MTQYIRLDAGDSIGYNLWNGQVDFYTSIGPEVQFRGETYHTLDGFSFPNSGECPTGHYLIREDGKGDVYLSDSLNEFLLYRTNAAVGGTWSCGDLTGRMESRTDSVVTRFGTYTGCLRISLGYNSAAQEVDWLAPNVGLVSMIRYQIDYVPRCLSWEFLTDLKLKTASRR